MRKVVIVFVSVLGMLFLNSFFLFAGPVRGKVIDAKTGSPLLNVKVELVINGTSFCPSPAGCNGWNYRNVVYTDSNGSFKFPFLLKMKTPLDTVSERNLDINGGFYGKNEMENYENLSIRWIPFFKRTAELVPTPAIMSLGDCKDNLNREQQMRCAGILAIRDSKKIKAIKTSNQFSDISYSYSQYLASKYKHEIIGMCNEQLKVDYTIENCSAVLAAEQKNRQMCKNTKYQNGGIGMDNLCLFYAALDLKDKSWCLIMPSSENNQKDLFPSREYCEEIIENNK